jgi:hypothetical protein
LRIRLLDGSSLMETTAVVAWSCRPRRMGAPRPVVAGIRERCTLLSAPVCEGAERGRGVVWNAPDVAAEVSYSELMLARLRDAISAVEVRTRAYDA